MTSRPGISESSRMPFLCGNSGIPPLGKALSPVTEYLHGGGVSVHRIVF